MSIMSLLSPHDLLALCRTCKLFNCLANDLLRNVKLSIQKWKVYKLGLVSLVRQARLVRVGLDISEKSSNLSDESPGLFSRNCLRRFLNGNQSKMRFEEDEEMKDFFFDLSNMRLKVNLGQKSFAYLDSLFTYLASNINTLKALDCEGGNLSGCNQDLLANAVSGILIVNFERVWLSTLQLTKIFTKLGEGFALLQYLSLVEEDLSNVDKNVLAKGIVKLTEVDLGKTNLGKEQLECLLDALSTATPLCLKTICMGHTNLTDVTPTLLSSSITRLEKADLSWTNLNNSQLIRLVTSIVHSPSCLSSMSLAGVKLSTLPPLLLSNLLTKLTAVDLGWTELTADQSVSVLSTLASGNSIVHSLVLDSRCMEHVSDQVVVGLCNTVRRLIVIGGWDAGSETAHVVYDAILHSSSIEDCNLFCSGVPMTRLIKKYPSVNQYIQTTRKSWVFLNR